MSKPSISRLQELLHVDVETGHIAWAKGRGRAGAGSEAGRKHRTGYVEVQVDGQMLKAHSIVWLFGTGDWPERIDHINGVRDDNRLMNLREATAAANSRNRTNWRHRKLLGAHIRPDGRWAACIRSDGVHHFLGVFPSEEDAHARYRLARSRIDDAERAARHRVLEEMQADRLALQGAA